MNNQHIIILGGMGPQASLELHRRLIVSAAKNGAVNGGEYPRITHLSLSVDDFISDQKQSDQALKTISKTLTPFYGDKQAVAIIACNTAHLLLPDLRTMTGMNFASLIDITIKDVLLSDIQSIGILASPTTISTKLYESKLKNAGLTVINPTKSELEIIEVAIRYVISGNNPDNERPNLQEIIDTMIAKGAEAIILGCTELSVIFSNNPHQSLIDPLHLVVKEQL